MTVTISYQTTTFDSDIDNTVTDLFTGPGNLRGFHLENPSTNAGDHYIQFFNAKAADVTLGTTPPYRVYEIVLGGSRDEDPQTGVDEHFPTACSYAFTTTSSGNTDPANGAKGYFKYKTLGL